MTDSEKVSLIGEMITDFWEYNSDAEIAAGARAFVVAINSVVEFKEGQNEV